jgi:hypothetical protein
MWVIYDKLYVRGLVFTIKATDCLDIKLTRLRASGARNLGSILGSGKKLFSTTPSPIVLVS